MIIHFLDSRLKNLLSSGKLATIDRRQSTARESGLQSFFILGTGKVLYIQTRLKKNTYKITHSTPISVLLVYFLSFTINIRPVPGQSPIPWLNNWEKAQIHFFFLLNPPAEAGSNSPATNFMNRNAALAHSSKNKSTSRI